MSFAGVGPILNDAKSAFSAATLAEPARWANTALRPGPAPHGPGESVGTDVKPMRAVLAGWPESTNSWTWDNLLGRCTHLCPREPVAYGLGPDRSEERDVGPA